MSRPPPRPEIPTGNTPTQRPVIRQTSNQTFNNQTIPYYQERLRLGNNQLIVFFHLAAMSLLESRIIFLLAKRNVAS